MTTPDIVIVPGELRITLFNVPPFHVVNPPARTHEDVPALMFVPDATFPLIIKLEPFNPLNAALISETVKSPVNVIILLPLPLVANGRLKAFPLLVNILDNPPVLVQRIPIGPLIVKPTAGDNVIFPEVEKALVAAIVNVLVNVIVPTYAVPELKFISEQVAPEVTVTLPDVALNKED